MTDDLFSPETYNRIKDELKRIQLEPNTMGYRNQWLEYATHPNIRDRYIAGYIAYKKKEKEDVHKYETFMSFINDAYKTSPSVIKKLEEFAKPFLLQKENIDESIWNQYANEAYEHMLARLISGYDVHWTIDGVSEIDIRGVRISDFYTSPSDDILNKWKSMVLPWIRNMSSEDRYELSQSVYWYAWHYDGYLNAATRNRPFSRSRMIRNFLIEDFQFEYNEREGDFNHITQSNNPECTKERILNSPGMDFKYNTIIPTNINANSINMESIIESYIEMIKNTVKRMYTSFTTQALILSEPMTLYRSIIIPKNSFNPVLSGFTSTSFSIIPSLYITNSTISNMIPNILPSTHEIALMKITFPAGTRCIPVGICPIFCEKEIIIVSQGTLIIKKEFTDPYIHKDLPITYYTCDFEITADMPSLHEFTLTNERVHYGGHTKRYHKSRKSKKIRCLTKRKNKL